MTLVLSWVFDLRAGQIERTRNDEAGGVMRNRVIPVIALLLSLVVAGLIWWGIRLLG